MSPQLVTSIPGPASGDWSRRNSEVSVPMGPPRSEGSSSLVFSRASGVNVWDVDGNRFVDLAAGFGSLLLGHGHPKIVHCVSEQARQLMQAMGDVYPAAIRIRLLERLCALFPQGPALGALAQSGSDAVSLALKTAVLATGRSGVVAFEGSYHGLGYGPLAVSGLRDSYRQPFASQLNPAVSWHPYPGAGADTDAILAGVERELARGGVGAVIYEPILGRGGVVPLADGVAARLREIATKHDVLLVADEIWTGLGRAGSWLVSSAQAVVPDLICLGKGLGGGLPVSACIGRAPVMQHWAQPREVVHTSTFAGAPLACAAALATLDILEADVLVERAREIGSVLLDRLRAELGPLGVAVRGNGLMIGIDVGDAPGVAVVVLQQLAQAGYLVSTGGGSRQVVVITPPLIIDDGLLHAFVDKLRAVLLERLA